MNRYAFQFLTILTLAVLVSGCVISRDPISGKKKQYGYSWADEVKLGTEADSQIISQYGLYDDERLSTYVDSLGQAMVELSHLRRPGAEPEWVNTPFHFRVLDSPVVNAFALPGGFVYVTRGLLAHVENEAQLAVVIGHEIGHVAARHASRRAKNQILGQAALIVGAVGGQILAGGNAAEQVLNYGGAGAQLLLLSYSRGDETQSDQLGVEYASLAGYQAAEGSGFFRTLKRMSDQSGQDIPSFLQTHPDPGQRETRIVEEATRWPTDGRAKRIGRSWYQEQINGLVFGENPRQGYVHGSRFVHPDLEFEFQIPGGFRVSNQPAQVILISEDGKAAVRLMIDSEHKSTEEAANAFSAEEGVTVVDSGKTSAYGMNTHYLIADAKINNGEEVRIRMHFIDYKGTLYSFMAFSGRPDFKAYDGKFVPMIESFRPLLEADILEIKPERIRIQHAEKAAKFQALIEGHTTIKISANTLAILNQLELSDSVPQGFAYKLVE